MAIAFGNQTSANNNNQSSLSFTGPVVSGIDTIGFVSVNVQTNLTITNVTWGGVNCTFINGKTEVNSGVERLELWYIINPSSAANVVISRTGSTNGLQGKATYYTGASQTGQPDNNTTKETVGASMDISLTPVHDNCWVILNARSDGADLSAGAGTTLRGVYSGHGVFDNNGPITPPTLTHLIVNCGVSADIWGCMASFAPNTTESLSVSDSTAVSDIPKIELVSMISVSDSSAVTATPSISIATLLSLSDSTVVSDRPTIAEFSFVSSDEPAEVEVSDYKWLTQTLKDAQLGPGYTPHFTCKVVDDSLVPNAIMTSPNLPILGKAVSAPDGSILVAGGDGSGNLKFWKLSDASQAFPVGTTLATTSGGANFRDDLPTSIASSDWINGTYVIDIYCFANSGPNVVIRQFRSTDGGITFSSPFAINNIGISVSAQQNMSLAAGTPVYDPATQNVRALFFYVKVTGTNGFYTLRYQICRGGSAFEADTPWSRMVDSQDWTFHSIDATWDGTYDHVVFSGRHNWYDTVGQSANFSIYTTRLDRITSNAGTDVWQLVKEVFVANSSSVLNLNDFAFPQISYDGSVFYIVISAIVTTDITTSAIGIDQSSPLITQYTFLIQSSDMNNFTYPNPIVNSDGSQFYIEPDAAVSLVPQLGTPYYYLLGNGQNWQFVKNDVVADITNDVISYEVQEMAGGSFQVSITLGNANNKWVGTSPTGTGASAIVANKKIFLEQGYATSVGKEIVPRNVFFIDTIQQQTASNTNTAVITGRDISRNLQILTSKYSFTNDGPQVYTDLFDSSLISLWQVIDGALAEQNLGVASGNAALLSAIGTDNVVILSQQNNNVESSLIFCMAKLPNFASAETPYLAIYPIFADTDNYFRILIQYNQSVPQVEFVTEVVVNGTLHASSPTVIPQAILNKVVPIYIRKYNYHTYDVLLGSWTAVNSGIGQYTNTVLDPAGSPAPEILISGFQIDQYFTNSEFVVNGNPGIGAYSLLADGIFQFFKFLRFGDSLSVQEASEYLGTLAGITDYSPKYDFVDSDYILSNYQIVAGGYSVANGLMSLTPQSVIFNTEDLILNGEMEFTAKVQSNSGNLNGMHIGFAFRASSDLSRYYYFDVESVANSIGAVIVSLRLNVSGTIHTLASSSMSEYGSQSNLIGLDITKTHNYRVVFDDQVFQIFIDGRMYLMWHDNNVILNSNNWLTSNDVANWGVLSPSSNSVVSIGEFKSLNMYNQVPNVTVNPGDDIAGVLSRVIESAYGWSYTDMMGRFVVQNLNFNDLVSYTYEDLIYKLQADTANQQFINEVTVTGQNVIATVTDPTLLAQMGAVRSLSITDYTITTYQAAGFRANQELLNANRFNNQNTPSHPMNVGAEIFDVIKIDNTGGNSTGVLGNFRVYNENFINGGASGEYSVEIETGTLS